MFGVLAVLGVGYVLGTRAGRERYEQIAATARAVTQSPATKAVIDAIVECSKIGRPSLPVVVPVAEFRDIFGIALTNMINGADPKEELAKATEQFKPIPEKSEKS